MSAPPNPHAAGAELNYAQRRSVAGVLRSFRGCLAVWALTRFLTVGVGSGIALAFGRSFTHPWRIWDAGWFLYVAHHGYAFSAMHPESPNFYPLYPGLLRFASLLLGGATVVGGVLLAFPLTLAVFLLMVILARDVADEDSGEWSVAYLALFPYGFFLQALYSEATFLVCAISAFLAAERRRFLAAGVLAGLAMLARPTGIAVLAGLVILASRRATRWADLLRLSVSLVVFSIFPLILALQGRSPLAFLRSEHGWRDYSGHNPVSFLIAPFESVYDGARAAWTAAVNVFDSLNSGVPLSPFAVHNLAAFATLLLFVPLSAVAWRRLGSPYGVYCAVSLAIPLTTRPFAAPLLSLPRFALVLFPCFIVLGALPLGRRGHGALLAASSAGLVGVLYLWNHGGHFVS